ncbi:MAG TPA: hypothetical protein VFC65_10425 [Prolixibacteraceae bacterium]|nr:hypothetical protein [Prolixibacteraceae bacterium]
MWRKTIQAILLLLTISAGSLKAQSFQEFTSLYKNTEDVKSGQFNFRFESLGFFQNNEYLGDFVKGYTLPGALFRPKLTYSPTDALYLEVGAHLIRYNGRDQLEKALPWFSARYRFSENFSVVTGNLDQNNLHGLPEQLWEPERMYTDRPEAGLQFLYSGTKLNAQTWISWEQFIQQDDPFQEHFTFGLTGDYRAYQNSALSVKLPVQILFYHQGGEINTAPEGGERPGVQTHANFSAGWEMAMNVGQKIKTINLNGYWFGYDAVTKDSNTLPFSKGHAYLLETSAQTRHSRISVSYWNAFQFIAPKGRLLYQSVSDSDPTFSQADRSIVSAKYFWQKEITKDARVAFHVETFIDIPSGDLSYSYGFYLLLNQDFLLKKF